MDKMQYGRVDDCQVNMVCRSVMKNGILLTK